MNTVKQQTFKTTWRGWQDRAQTLYPDIEKPAALDRINGNREFRFQKKKED